MNRRLLALCGVLLLAGCDRDRPTVERATFSRQVRVAAAADLRFALQEVARRFEQGHDIKVVASYGSSGTFYAQLLNQAPFDMFLSADVEYPKKLAERGLALDGSDFQYGVGRLVLWVRGASPLDVQARGLGMLTDASVAHVAIANPAHAPYGRAAVAAMQAAAVYDAVKPKLVFGENVEHALQFAESGAADAGIVALALVHAPQMGGSRAGRYIDVPLDTYPRIVQGGIILRAAADVDAARTLRAYVISPDGRAILKRYGFFLPES